MVNTGVERPHHDTSTIDVGTHISFVPGALGESSGMQTTVTDDLESVINGTKRTDELLNFH